MLTEVELVALFYISTSAYLDPFGQIIYCFLDVDHLNCRQASNRNLPILRFSDVQGLHSSRQQIKYFLVINLIETDSYPTVSLLPLLLKDHLQCSRQDSSLKAAKGCFVEVSIRVVLGAITNYRIGFSGSGLSAE
jgi:hypothetical protein